MSTPKLMEVFSLREAKCPECGNPRAYVGMSAVECPNPNCRHYKPGHGQLIKDSTPYTKNELMKFKDSYSSLRIADAMMEWDNANEDFEANVFFVINNGKKLFTSAFAGEYDALFEWDPDVGWDSTDGLNGLSSDEHAPIEAGVDASARWWMDQP
jgi:hypothetical protein